MAENAPLDFAARMAEALLDPDQPVPALIGRPAQAVERRFGVYRNNVMHGLVEALAAVFPALRRVVGPDWFDAMAAAHVRAHPPSSRLVFEYGADMPRFLETFPPAARMPYLPDLARLELAWLAAYHAGDREPLDPAVLAAVPEPALPKLRFEPHPALRIIASPFAIHSIFDANRAGDGPATRIDAAEPQACLVTRPRLSVMVTAMMPAQAAFARSLAKGETLADAAEVAGGSLDLGAALGALIAAGAFAGCSWGDGR